MLWKQQEAPASTGLDRVLLLINLPFIGICAVLRAVCWLLEINMAGLPFCSPMQSVQWQGSGFDEEDCDYEEFQDRLPAVWRAIAERKAQRFPHAGGRAFTEHITGVANILGMCVLRARVRVLVL